MDERSPDMHVFASESGMIVLDVYLSSSDTISVVVRLTPSQAERLADDLGLAIEQARKARIERAS